MTMHTVPPQPSPSKPVVEGAVEPGAQPGVTATPAAPGLSGGLYGALADRGDFQPRTIPEQIADELSMAIVEGRHADGERITEPELAARFGVSRGPVRDALRLLARRGLIEIVPRRGNYVKTVSINGIADLFNVRNALSGSAARAMAQRPVDSYLQTLDRRITEMEQLATRPDSDADIRAFAVTTTRAVAAIAKGSGNDLLASLLVDLANLSVWNVIWKQVLDFAEMPRRIEVSRQFRAIHQAIAQRKPDLAEARTRALLEDVRDQAIATLRRLRNEDVAPEKLARSERPPRIT